MTERLAGSSRSIDWVVVTIGFVASRVAAAVIFGITFDDEPLRWFWQYVDPVLLRTDALRSIFYQHAQPPLFNLYLATVTKACGDSSTGCFAASFHGFGLVLHLALLALLRRLGVGRAIAVGTVLLFAFSPASVLYESWLFYTYPIAMLLVVAAVFVHRAVSGCGRTVDLVVLFAVAAAIVLSRSLFHLVWLGGVIVLVAWPLRGQARRVIAAAAIPALLCVAVYAKNAVLFDQFSGSSWLGMNLARLAIEPLPLDERRELVAAGEIGPVSLIEPFSPVTDYPASLRAGARTDHPVLTKPAKSSGVVNYNHGAYPAIARAYARDARTLIRARPDVYAASVAEAWRVFALPPAVNLFLMANHARLGAYANLWMTSLYGFTPVLPSDEPPETTAEPKLEMHAWGALFLLLALGAVGIAVVRGARDWLRPGGDRSVGATLLFVSGTVVYVAVIGNAFEYGENNRFRFLVEPMLFALIAWLVSAVRWRARHAGATPDPCEAAEG